ncbi:MAG TPA: DUF1569 domain-containing protein, partial [Pyrinomonadaceae bacterium]|nr:DUF1569 domain-containing protein [Pyrinomonadaceae bacterium]
MGSILNESDRTAICSRLRSLSASSTARWGRMSLTEMLQHLQLSAQMAVGELTVASANKRVFQLFPLKHLILYVLPFPKGAPTAPELRPDAAAPFDEERAAVLALLDRIGAGPREGTAPAHPLFGPLSRSEWGVVTYK